MNTDLRRLARIYTQPAMCPCYPEISPSSCLPESFRNICSKSRFRVHWAYGMIEAWRPQCPRLCEAYRCNIIQSIIHVCHMNTWTSWTQADSEKHSAVLASANEPWNTHTVEINNVTCIINAFSNGRISYIYRCLVCIDKMHTTRRVGGRSSGNLLSKQTPQVLKSVIQCLAEWDTAYENRMK